MRSEILEVRSALPLVRTLQLAIVAPSTYVQVNANTTLVDPRAYIVLRADRFRRYRGPLVLSARPLGAGPGGVAARLAV